jgi:hypothetical protein
MNRFLIVIAASLLGFQAFSQGKDLESLQTNKKQQLREWKLESSTQVFEKDNIIS